MGVLVLIVDSESQHAVNAAKHALPLISKIALLPRETCETDRLWYENIVKDPFTTKSERMKARFSSWKQTLKIPPSIQQKLDQSTPYCEWEPVYMKKKQSQEEDKENVPIFEDILLYRLPPKELQDFGSIIIFSYRSVQSGHVHTTASPLVPLVDVARVEALDKTELRYMPKPQRKEIRMEYDRSGAKTAYAAVMQWIYLTKLDETEDLFFLHYAEHEPVMPHLDMNNHNVTKAIDVAERIYLQDTLKIAIQQPIGTFPENAFAWHLLLQKKPKEFSTTLEQSRNNNDEGFEKEEEKAEKIMEKEEERVEKKIMEKEEERAEKKIMVMNTILFRKLLPEPRFPSAHNLFGPVFHVSSNVGQEYNTMNNSNHSHLFEIELALMASKLIAQQLKKRITMATTTTTITTIKTPLTNIEGLCVRTDLEKKPSLFILQHMTEYCSNGYLQFPGGRGRSLIEGQFYEEPCTDNNNGSGESASSVLHVTHEDCAEIDFSFKSRSSNPKPKPIPVDHPAKPTTLSQALCNDESSNELVSQIYSAPSSSKWYNRENEMGQHVSSYVDNLKKRLSLPVRNPQKQIVSKHW